MPPRKPVKQYITLKNGVLAFVVICAIILVAVKVGIGEWKKGNKAHDDRDKELLKKYEVLEKKSLRDSVTLDSVLKWAKDKSEKREKEVVKIYHEKEIRVKEINNPAITNSELRKLLAN